VSSCNSSVPAVPPTSAQFRLTSEAHVRRISAVASRYVTRTVAVSSTAHVTWRRRSSLALTASGGWPTSAERRRTRAIRDREDAAAGDRRIDPPVPGALVAGRGGSGAQGVPDHVLDRPIRPSWISSAVRRTIGAWCQL